MAPPTDLDVAAKTSSVSMGNKLPLWACPEHHHHTTYLVIVGSLFSFVLWCRQPPLSYASSVRRDDQQPHERHDRHGARKRPLLIGRIAPHREQKALTTAKSTNSREHELVLQHQRNASADGNKWLLEIGLQVTCCVSDFGGIDRNLNRLVQWVTASCESEHAALPSRDDYLLRMNRLRRATSCRSSTSPP